MGSHMIEFIPFPDFCGPGNVIWLCRFNVLFLDWTFHTHELGVRSAIGRFDSPAWYIQSYFHWCDIQIPHPKYICKCICPNLFTVKSYWTVWHQQQAHRLILYYVNSTGFLSLQEDMWKLVISLRIWIIKQYPTPRLTGHVKSWPNEKKTCKPLLTILILVMSSRCLTMISFFFHKLIY